MKKRIISLLLIAVMVLGMVGCGSSSEEPAEDAAVEEEASTEVANAKALADQNFDTSYEPAKDTYKIYCTYKLVHAWYDAIEVGVKAAVEDLASKGVTVDYEWYAPVEPDAVDQVNSIETAVGQGYDMILVDVNQVETTRPAINDAVAAGVKVGLFASSDVEDCDRAFFVGNTDNYGDGAALAEAVCEKMMEDGLMKKDDVKMLAFMFTAPVTSLIQLCTREPDKQDEVMKQAEAFIKYFIAKYVKQ